MNALVQPPATLPKEFDLNTDFVDFDKYTRTGTASLEFGDAHICIEFTAELSSEHVGHTGPIDYYGGCQDVYADFWKVTSVTVADSEGVTVKTGPALLWDVDLEALEDALNKVCAPDAYEYDNY